MQHMIVYDEMGNPQVAVYDPGFVGNSVAGWAPFIPNQSGPSGGNYTNPTSVNDSANGLLELANLHNSLLVSGQLVASGTGDNANAQLPTFVVQRPWVEPPEGSIPFDQQQVVVMPAVAGTAVVVTIVVPDGYDGVIRAYSWNVTGGGFVQGSGDLQVQVLRDGAAIRNYDNILVEKGSIQTPRVISPLRVYSGQVITLVINHIANGLLAGNVIGCFSGYYYPSLS
jgi:hypothetical protein